jgi:hypothetical protein
VTKEEALKQLEDVEVVPCVSGGIGDIKEILEACLSAGIPAILDRQESCGAHGSCTPKIDLCVRQDDLPKVVSLMRERWQSLLDQEGTLAEHLAGEGESEELPCPACGVAAPLVEGACKECGLQLE